jgi:hypothetical protein
MSDRAATLDPVVPLELGPLRGLAGVWEGDEGLDVAYANARGLVVETPFRERAEFKPFGPVDNGQQVLFGLDYRMAAWRADEEMPFHTEVGYWLWDAAEGQVMRCFMVPRGSTILAGGAATADAATFTLAAEVGSESYGILSNLYLAKLARSTSYRATISIDGDVWSYDQETLIEHARWHEVVCHTDRNRLRRVPPS